jgi:hypothetical protein
MNPTKNLIEPKLLMNPTKNLIELKLYRNPTKNLIEPKLLMNPTKNLIELKLYRNPTKNLIELKFHMMAPFIVEQDFLEYFHSLSTVFDSWRYVQSIQNNYLYLCHLNIFPCKQALHR